MLGKLPPINNFDCSYKPPNDGKVHTYYQTVYNGEIDSSEKVNNTDESQQSDKSFMFQKYPELENIYQEMKDDPKYTGLYKMQVDAKFGMINLEMMNPEHFGFSSDMKFDTVDDLKVLINDQIEIDKVNISTFPNDKKYLDALNIDELLFEKIKDMKEVNKSENDQPNGILITRF